MRMRRNAGVVVMTLAMAGSVAVGCSGTSATGAGGDGSSVSTVVSTIRIATPSGQYVVQGAILQKYNALGSTSGPLGLPIINEQPAPNGGRVSKFDGGAIYWTPQTGAHAVWGKIRDTYEHDHGGPGGPLGYPVSDEHAVPGGHASDFQHGTIIFRDGALSVEQR